MEPSNYDEAFEFETVEELNEAQMSYEVDAYLSNLEGKAEADAEWFYRYQD